MFLGHVLILVADGHPMFGMILQWDTVCFTTRPEKLQG
jgi:hypothetical protein